MKVPQFAFVPAAAAALLLAGCDRGTNQAEAQRLAEERAAIEREKAALASAKAAAQQADNDAERARLEAERAELKQEKDRIAAQRAGQAQAAQDERSAAERQARIAAEQRANAETAARRDAEAREREAREDADQARVTQTVSFFYDALDPYGDWVELDRYGYAFRPNANRNAGWRPYTDGGWVYTDYGWTWRSDEPFGWATYHYGRWARVPRLGWVWIPGTEWGPAWVSWRRSSDYIGWAPLPPDAWSPRGFNAAVDSYFDIGPGFYTFLLITDFGEPTYLGRVVDPAQNVTIINQTTNITNVVYKTVQNRTTIVNEGPDITLINQRARQPVRRMKLERLEGGAPQAAKVQGNTLQVMAPELKKSAPAATKPRVVKENVKAAELDRGWAGAKADETKVRADAAKQARETEQAEIRQPKPASAPPTPFRPATPKSSPPEAAPVLATPEPPRHPMTPVPLRPNRPVKPEAQPAEQVPPAAPRPAGETPATPGPLPRPGKPNRPVPPTPSEAAPPAPAVPNEGRPKAPERRNTPSREETLPPNRPEPGEAPLKRFQPLPNAAPTPPVSPTPGESTDPDGKQRKKAK